MGGLDEKLASLVAEQRTIAVPQDLGTIDRVDEHCDVSGLLHVEYFDGDVPHARLPTEADRREFANDAAAFPDRTRHFGQLAGAVRYLNPEGAVESHRLGRH